MTRPHMPTAVCKSTMTAVMMNHCALFVGYMASISAGTHMGSGKHRSPNRVSMTTYYSFCFGPCKVLYSHIFALFL